MAREAGGDGIALMLDTNCPWSVEEAIRIGRRLERYDLRWLEEPVWPPEDYAGLARVRAAVRIPIASGENDATVHGFAALLAAGAADIVQPSMTKVGGVGEMKKIAALAAAANATLVPHSFYFGPGLAATLHVAASTPGCPMESRPENWRRHWWPSRFAARGAWSRSATAPASAPIQIRRFLRATPTGVRVPGPST